MAYCKPTSHLGLIAIMKWKKQHSSSQQPKQKLWFKINTGKCTLFFCFDTNLLTSFPSNAWTKSVSLTSFFSKTFASFFFNKTNENGFFSWPRIVFSHSGSAILFVYCSRKTAVDDFLQKSVSKTCLFIQRLFVRWSIHWTNLFAPSTFA